MMVTALKVKIDSTNYVLNQYKIIMNITQTKPYG